MRAHHSPAEQVAHLIGSVQGLTHEVLVSVQGLLVGTVALLLLHVLQDTHDRAQEQTDDCSNSRVQLDSVLQRRP